MSMKTLDTLYYPIFYKYQNKGMFSHAFGALIWMLFAMVGAILSTVTGVVIRSAFMPIPYIMIGKGITAVRLVYVSCVFSFSSFQPGVTSITMSPLTLGLNALRIFFMSSFPPASSCSLVYTFETPALWEIISLPLFSTSWRLRMRTL